MSYNNQNQEKPLPSIEYTLKNIGWNLKVIADCLTKLVEMQGGQMNQPQGRSQNYSNQNSDKYPF
jgi:hypothetical protein